MENFKNINPVRVDKSAIISLEKGKVPPQAVDIEEAVLGAILMDNRGIDTAIEILTADVFYKESHRVIFEAMFQLFDNDQPVDMLTLSSQLKKNGTHGVSGGDFYLIGLTQKVASSAHIEYHCRILLQQYIKRSCIKMSSGLIERSYEDDADTLELLSEAYSSLGDISDLINVGKSSNFRDDVNDYMNQKTVNTRGVPSSIQSLDKKLNGYQDDDLIILAARPGMGKTAFILNEILECGLQGIPVAMFSLEMSTKQIIGRMLSIISGVDSIKISHRNMTDSESQYVNKCSKLLAKLPIYIDDTPALSTLEFKIKLSKLHKTHGIKKAFVDYLQLMTVKSKTFSRENEVSTISSSLKAAAKSLHIPITALSQLSRKVEERGSSKRPLLSDLRDSGSIEQDADIVMFIYRPEYYKIDEWDDDEHSPTPNTAEIEIAKFRNGETGFTRVGCELRYMRFMDLEHVGEDLTDKYFRQKSGPAEIKEKTVFELKPASVAEAFGEPDTSDVPF